MTFLNMARITATAALLACASSASAFAIIDTVDFRLGSDAKQGIGKDFQVFGTGMRTLDGVYLSSRGLDGHLWWDHDINDDGYSHSLHNIDSAIIYFDLQDDSCKRSTLLACGIGYDAPNESVSFDMALVEGGASLNAMGSQSSVTYAFNLALPALTDLRSDGVLDLLQIEMHDRLWHRASDLYVQESRLIVNYSLKQGDPNQIPEPGSLALMILGLIGLISISKRRKQAQAARISEPC
ncbi:MAG: PEP-CTERM sorting domain-containing protein [Pseudomonadales bacterium]|nr:PEP-CTERM sorting domain-containing protein [Pseudomonadales bacterium]